MFDALTVGTHTGPGAFEINTLASISALIFSGIWLMAWTKARLAYMLILAFGWAGLCLYWGMFAVTAGPNPLWDRAQLAWAIRVCLTFSVVTLLVGKGGMMRTAWIFRPRSKPHQLTGVDPTVRG